jgi:aspartate/methionine/tyrosine aminotransferase
VSPCFPAAKHTLLACGAIFHEVPLQFEQSFALDIDRITSHLNAHTRIVSLASPGNPSGVSIPSATIRMLLSVMATLAPQAILFVDETYRQATYDGDIPESAAGWAANVVVGGSISKAHGAPGLRVG